MNLSKINKGTNKLLVLIFTALVAQLLGSYYARKFVYYNYFFAAWVVLRIVFPCIILKYLSIPFKEIGLSLPKVTKKMLAIIAGMSLIFVGVLVAIYFWGGYLQTYSSSFGENKFLNFMIFTSSTLTGWEFLHRGVLLFGAFYILKKEFKLEEGDALKIAIILPWIFECVFHFIKPEMEAWGMLVGSPILSYLAIRTKSIWTAFFAHLYVEVIFIIFVIMR